MRYNHLCHIRSSHSGACDGSSCGASEGVHLLQLDLERKLRGLLTKEKEKAEEQAALAMGLCTGAFALP